jgi:hypothetical protein
MIRCLMFLTIALMPLARAADQAEWRELAGQDKPSYWLLAFEEAEFIRKSIGDWLPVAIFKTEAKEPLKWRLDHILRKSNQCELSISLVSGRNREVCQKYSWFDRGPDAELTGDVQTAEKEVYISIRQNDGSVRRFWIRREDGIGGFRNTVRVSKAMLVWKWENALPVDL